MSVGSVSGSRKSVGLWRLALAMMTPALLVIRDKGLKAKAFGDPAVQGPSVV